MNSCNSFLHFAFPYVLICGSYLRNRTNDKLCYNLGNELAKHNFGMISGGGRPGIKAAESMDRTLTDLNQYEPTRIITVFRKKINEEAIKIKRIGCSLFVGNNIYEMRNYLLSKSKVLIAISGAIKTKEEILLAQEQNISIIPVGMTGGTAHDVWLQYYRSGKYKNEDLFLQLNKKNPFIASNAILSILQDLTFND